MGGIFNTSTEMNVACIGHLDDKSMLNYSITIYLCFIQRQQVYILSPSRGTTGFIGSDTTSVLIGFHINTAISNEQTYL